MGGCAGLEMFSDSDIDVVALYADDGLAPQSRGPKPLPPATYHIRLMQRVIAALSAPTSEGILYETDARLRPAGNDGPLAAALDGYFDYQKNSAWTWEHMSLIRARVIAAEKDAAARFKRGRAQVLAMPRDMEKCLADMRDMQGKLGRAFGRGDPWQVKYRPGGVMDVMFAIHFLAFAHARTVKNLFDPDLRVMIARLQAARKIKAADARVLCAALDTAAEVQSLLRLTIGQKGDLEKMPEGLKDFIARRLLHGKGKASFVAAKKRLQTVFAQSDKTCRAILKHGTAKKKKAARTAPRPAPRRQGKRPSTGKAR